MMFAVQMTVHTALQVMPTQILFGQEAIFNIPFEVVWQLVQMYKQVLIKKENAQRMQGENLICTIWETYC